jgi:hypothetical protein
MHNGGPDEALDHTRLLRLGSPHIAAIPKPLRRAPDPQAGRRLPPLAPRHPAGAFGITNQIIHFSLVPFRTLITRS